MEERVLRIQQIATAGLISSGVQVQVHLFTLIQLQYNDNKKKKEVKTELTIHQVGYNHRAITSG